jgi:hypothetical protein
VAPSDASSRGVAPAEPALERVERIGCGGKAAARNRKAQGRGAAAKPARERGE